MTHAGTQSAKAVSVISEKSLAGVVADNALIQARMQPLKLGAASGSEVQMSHTFTYTVTTTKTAIDNFYSLDVRVKRDGSEHIIMTRQAFRGSR